MSGNDAARLREDEREALLVPCSCGHSINDHGSMAGCWMCPEEGRECDVRFEDMLMDRLAPIVAARAAEAAQRDGEAVVGRVLEDAADALTKAHYLDAADYVRAIAALASVQQGDEEPQR